MCDESFTGRRRIHGVNGAVGRMSRVTAIANSLVAMFLLVINTPTTRLTLTVGRSTQINCRSRTHRLRVGVNQRAYLQVRTKCACEKR